MNVCNVDPGLDAHVLRFDDERLFLDLWHGVGQPAPDRPIERNLETFAGLLHRLPEKLLGVVIQGDCGPHGVIIASKIYDVKMPRTYSQGSDGPIILHSRSVVAMRLQASCLDAGSRQGVSP